MDTFMHHIGLSTAEERETLDVDVLFVGGGPASLAGAYHLANLIEIHNENISTTGGDRLERKGLPDREFGCRRRLPLSDKKQSPQSALCPGLHVESRQ
jgi:hypothetical protein